MEAVYAYTAGFVEADGCFHITNSGAGIRITNKCIPVLQSFKDNFGGSISSKVIPTGCFEWNLYGEKAVDLINKLKPYLRMKNNEADILIKFSQTIGPRGKVVLKETKELRDLLRQDLKMARKIRNGS